MATSVVSGDGVRGVVKNRLPLVMNAVMADKTAIRFGKVDRMR